MNAVKRLATAGLRSLPLWLWERIAPKDVVALDYHLVSDEDLPHQKYYRYKSARQFESDVIYARDRAVRYDEVSAHRLRSARLPPNRILFTFDDGLVECFHVIRPILRKHSVDGVFFVTTGFLEGRMRFFEVGVSLCLAQIERIDESRARAIAAELSLDEWASRSRQASDEQLALKRLTWARVAKPVSPAHAKLTLWLLGLQEDGEEHIDRACTLLDVDPGAYASERPIFMDAEQIRELVAEGFTVGSHGLSHRLLHTLDPRAFEDFVVSSCRFVCDITGQRKVPFSFPYNGGEVGHAVLADILRRNEFIELFFDTGGLRHGAAFVVERLWADPPSETGDGATNLPLLLRAAWSRRGAWYRDGPGVRPAIGAFGVLR